MLTKNPKQGRSADPADGWFGYYAGYSREFVAEALTYLDLPLGACVVDPWNGSGTTTDMADLLGYRGIGYDLNPAVVLVAKARLLRSDVRPSHLSLGKELLRCAGRYSAASFLPNEPLTAWFHPKAAASLRGIERAIQHLLLPTPYVRLSSLDSLSDVSPLAACYYVALFRTLRTVLLPFATSNPTWTRSPKNPKVKLRPSQQALYALFEHELKTMFAGMKPREGTTPPSATVVDVGNATGIALGDGAADAVVASPPYCTRIDYAVAMKPELAILGSTEEEFRALRLAMLGCTIMSPSVADDPNVEWGAFCSQLLSAIRNHQAHGSRTYYYQTHLQYFAGLYSSLREMSRVLNPRARAVLVVQDSYYKELHTDLQTITQEMCSNVGLELEFRRDYSSKNTKAALNTRRLKYRNTADATESVLIFRRVFSNTN